MELKEIKGNALLLHNALISTIKASKENFLILGQLIYELKKEQLFQQATGVEVWHDYLAQPEIGLSKGEANRLAQIYEHFIERLGYDIEEVSSIPIKSLHRLLPVVKNNELDKEELDGLMGDAQHLKQSDFRERMYDVRKGESAPKTYEYIIMRKCIETGLLERLFDIPAEEINMLVSKYNKDTTR